MNGKDRQIVPIIKHPRRMPIGNRSEEALQQARNALEVGVEQRVSELLKTNKQLIQEINEHKRAQELLQQHNRELELLNRLNGLFQACQTEKETYKVVAKMCKQLFPEASGCLYMIDDSQTLLWPVVSWGKFPYPAENCRPDACWVFRNNKMSVCEHHRNSLPGSPISSPHRSYLCVPITTFEQKLGVLSLCFDQGESEPLDEIHRYLIASRQALIYRVIQQYTLSLTNLRLREKLRLESICDPLTGLYNRRYMETALKQEASRIKRHNSQLGIIMLDVDHFKDFNDNYGHEAGDMVLKALGGFLKKNVRGEDIACRYGGEEFLLIMVGASLEAVRQRTEKLWIKLRDFSIEYRGQSLPITLSIGVAALPYHGPGVMDVVKAADTALYMAKTGGRNRVVVAPY